VQQATPNFKSVSDFIIIIIIIVYSHKNKNMQDREVAI